MKKFSTITGQNIPQDKKVEQVKLNEQDLFKTKVLTLMEQLLTIRTYGSVDRYLRAGSIKIAGKEMFLEALMDLLQEGDLKKEVKILESLKSEIKDWQVIDNKIEKVNHNIENIDSKKKIYSSRNKIKSLLNRYSDDEEFLFNKVDELCKKINSGEKAYLNSLSTVSLLEDGKYSKNTLLIISEKFQDKAKQLGYSIQ